MPSYVTTDPPDSVTQELIHAILDDAERHLESRLVAIEHDFKNRLQREREYLIRRTRERIKELIPDSEPLLLRRQKRDPIIPDWRVEGGEFSPDERKHKLAVRNQQSS